MKTKKLVLTALIAGIYFALCLILPFGYGPIQLRIAEIITLLPLFFGWTGVFGVTIGCALANLLSPFWIVDVVFGSSITFVAAVLTYLLRKKPILAAIPPVLLNALFLPIIWWFVAGDYGYLVNFASTLCSQFIIIIVVGVPLVYTLKKSGVQNLIDGFFEKSKKKNLIIKKENIEITDKNLESNTSNKNKDSEENSKLDKTE